VVTLGTVTLGLLGWDPPPVEGFEGDTTLGTLGITFSTTLLTVSPMPAAGEEPSLPPRCGSEIPPIL
jgi:hypothetical protein